MDEDIDVSVESDESEPFGIIEPFDRAHCHGPLPYTLYAST
jgi:hypothetical protein